MTTTTPQPSGPPQRLRELRSAQGWTQDRLARAAGLDRHLISRLENGKVKHWRLDWVQSLADALDVDRDDLVPPQTIRSLAAPPAGARTARRRPHVAVTVAPRRLAG